MKDSKIQWTDSSWNPWHGCRKVSDGCKHCYMFSDKERYGQKPTSVLRSKTTFNDPLKWPTPQRVFTCSWSDFFIEDADAWRAEAWDIIRRTPHLTYQILTKRPERILRHLPADWGTGWLHVWLGVSVENQKYADRRHAFFEAVPALTKFVSYEPSLELVDWRGWEFIDLLISGGESGHQARPSRPDYHRAARDFCLAHNIAYFFKQWGGWLPCSQAHGDEQLGQVGRLCHKTEFDANRVHAWPDRTHSIRLDKEKAGRLLDGREWNEMPKAVAP